MRPRDSAATGPPGKKHPIGSRGRCSQLGAPHGRIAPTTRRAAGHPADARASLPPRAGGHSPLPSIQGSPRGSASFDGGGAGSTRQCLAAGSSRAGGGGGGGDYDSSEASTASDGGAEGAGGSSGLLAGGPGLSRLVGCLSAMRQHESLAVDEAPAALTPRGSVAARSLKGLRPAAGCSMPVGGCAASRLARGCEGLSSCRALLCSEIGHQHAAEARSTARRWRRPHAATCAAQANPPRGAPAARRPPPCAAAAAGPGPCGCGKVLGRERRDHLPHPQHRLHAHEGGRAPWEGPACHGHLWGSCGRSASVPTAWYLCCWRSLAHTQVRKGHRMHACSAPCTRTHRQMPRLFRHRQTNRHKPPRR